LVLLLARLVAGCWGLVQEQLLLVAQGQGPQGQGQGLVRHRPVPQVLVQAQVQPLLPQGLLRHPPDCLAAWRAMARKLGST